MWTTRLATPADATAVARLFVELGIPEPVPDAERFATQMLPRVLVACAGDEVLGYASWRLYDRIAHIVNLVVDPRAQGRGLGRQLMDAVRAHVIAAGCTRWYLNVKRDNAPARRLYERCGMATERDVWVIRLDWARASALSGDASASAHDLPPAADAAVAARFAFDPGRLASLRARPGLHILGIAGGAAAADSADPADSVGPAAPAAPLAYAAFDPQFPGAVIFCVSRVALARPLLDACRAHADLSSFDFLRLVIDSDRPLYEALVAVGAELTFDLLQLGGALDG